MKVWNELQVVTEPMVVTIGNFDGVHQGHQALFARAQKMAEAQGWSWMVLTFEPHPLKVLHPQAAPLLISPWPMKKAYLQAAGVPNVFVMPFNRTVANWPPEFFLNDVIYTKLHGRGIVVGDNFTFGAKAAGDVTMLKAWGQERGVPIEICPPVRLAEEGAVISSSLVRRLLARH
ncbi:MAG: FAD synthetase family protein, partial [Firmicutes bacterium]|nr:FAD synthetase family protein [Bacillota bacterium]